MKKYITLLGIVVALASCDDIDSSKENISVKKVLSSDGDQINMIVIDGCEYITWRKFEGGYSSFSSGITHKANCKNHTHE